MTTSHLSRSWRRFALSCLIAATSAAAGDLPSSASATESLTSAQIPTAKPDVKLINTFISSDSESSLKSPRAIGGIQIIVHQAAADSVDSGPHNLGTHDSVPSFAFRGGQKNDRNDKDGDNSGLGEAGIVNWISATRTSESFNRLLSTLGVENAIEIASDSVGAAETPLRTIASTASDSIRQAGDWWIGRPKPKPKTMGWTLGAADLTPVDDYEDPCTFELIEQEIDDALADLNRSLRAAEVAAAREAERIQSAGQVSDSFAGFDDFDAYYGNDFNDDDRLDVITASGGVVPFVDFPNSQSVDSIDDLMANWIADPNFEIDDSLSLRPVIRQGDSARPDWNAYDDDRFDAVSTEDLIRRQLDELAAAEPIDVEFDDFAVIDELFSDADADLYPFAGSAPMITTLAEIEGPPAPQAGDRAPVAATASSSTSEAYRPYDLSATDYRLWSTLPSPDSRVCVRGKFCDDQPSPLWTFAENGSSEVESVQAVAAKSAEAVLGGIDPLLVQAETSYDFETYGSPDCVLEDFRWQIENAIYDHQPAIS